MSLSFYIRLLVLGFFLQGTVFAQTPILHLTMDKSTPGKVQDFSGKRNHAEIMGNLRFVPDKFGDDCRALSFEGGGYLKIPHNTSLDLDKGFTSAAWLKLPYSNGLQWVTLICKGETLTEKPNSPAYRVQMTNSTASYNTASTKTIDIIRQSFPQGQWFHFATVFNGYSLTVYVNGVRANQFVVSDPIVNNREDLNIGRDIPGAIEFFEGIMDDLKVWDNVLTPNQIQKVYRDETHFHKGNACPPPPSVPSRPVVKQNRPKPDPTPPTPPATPDPNIPSWDQYTEQEEEPVVASTPPQPQPDPYDEEPEIDEPVTAVSTPPSSTYVPPTDTAYDFSEVARNNIVLVLDVSASMRQTNRLPLLKETFTNLLQYMREEDRISVIAFAGQSLILVEGVPATRSVRISSAIDKLNSKGDTKRKPALKSAFKLAQRYYIDGGNNRIILATDADNELPEIFKISEKIGESNVYLSIFSFGDYRNNRRDQFDLIAENGHGNHEKITVDNVEAALLRELKAIRK